MTPTVRMHATTDDVTHAECEVTFESRVLDVLTVERLLQELPAADRDLICLRYEIYCPQDYVGTWPATLEEIGAYVGIRYAGGAMSPRQVRHRTRIVLRQLGDRARPPVTRRTSTRRRRRRS